MKYTLFSPLFRAFGVLLLGSCLWLSAQHASVDGRVWFNTASGTTANLNSVSAYGSDFAVAVGINGTILRYQDGAWSNFAGAPQDWSTTGVNATAILSPTSLWAGSNSSTTGLRGVSHWDGTNWGSIEIPADTTARQRVLGLWADRGSGYVFAALQSGRISHYNGSGWSSMATPGGTADMQAIHGTGLNNIWAVGNSGQVYQSVDSGTNWTVHALGADYASVSWHGVYTLGINNTWLVGSGGHIAHWDGEAFEVITQTSQTLRDVYAISENQVYVVGSASGTAVGTFLYFDGDRWSSVDLGADVNQHTWYSIDGDGERIWLVGNGGTILTSIPEPSQIALVLAVLLPVLWHCIRSRRNRS